MGSAGGTSESRGEGTALLCGTGAAGEAHSGVGWGSAALPQTLTRGRVEHFQSSPITFTLSTSHHGTLRGDTYSGQGAPVGWRQAPQNVHHDVFGDLCRLFKSFHSNAGIVPNFCLLFSCLLLKVLSDSKCWNMMKLCSPNRHTRKL